MTFHSILSSLKDFGIRYPAVLSGYIIYSYLFVTTIDFFLEVKNPGRGFDAFDFFKQFDSLIWMWLLALALVKVIDYRTRLHERETEELRLNNERRLQQAQLETLKEVVRGLQHEVNNPLTIIMMYLRKIERKGLDESVRHHALTVIRESAQRIAKILRRFSDAESYETTSSPVGHIATPPRERTERRFEAEPV
jgi:signal transduction histidine kinase